MRDLMSYHGLSSWTFSFGKSLRTYGYCWSYSKRIELSKALVELNSEEQALDAMLHEIAHALAPEGVHHGPEWVNIAKSIGCSGQRCCDDNVKLPYKFIGTCPSCSYELKAMRRTRAACRRCCIKYNHGAFDNRFLYQWKRI